MKRRAMHVCLLVLAIVPVAPAGAADVTQPPNKQFEFPVAGTLPCGWGLTGFGCAYNQPASTLGFRACENPFPEGSYLDVVTQPAPNPPAGKKIILDFTSFSDVDWDTWICTLLSNGSHNGGELGQGANVLGQLCDNFLGPENAVPIGCTEHAIAPAEAGHRYVLRAYNYFDIDNLRAIYSWIFV